MSFNRALLIAFIIIGIVCFIRFKTSTNQPLHNQQNLEEIEILYSKAEFETWNTNHQKELPRKILVKIEGGEQLVKVTDVMYCEKIKNTNKVRIYTENNYTPIESYMTLKKLKEKIGSAEFLYDNLNSYIINFNYVERVMKIPSEFNQNSYRFEVEMEGKENKITLPKDRKANFMKELKDYMGDY